jgi:hypothetical protein
MSSQVRQFIRHERDRMVRRELERLGYVLDYWLVYRIELIAPVVPTQRLRAGSRGSSRRLHELRMAGLA